MNQHIDFKLYLITDRKLFDSIDALYKVVDEALSAGVKALQLREKDMMARELLGIAYRLRDLTWRHQAKLFINDRLDIALSVRADGIHVGQSGIPVRDLRRVAGKDFLIGYSAHSPEEAAEADKEGADFITFGPVFSTPSKMKYGSPVGLKSLREAAGKVGLPVFGIGGIKSINILDVISSGASGIALISGILSAGEPAAAAREYLERVGERQ